MRTHAGVQCMCVCRMVKERDTEAESAMLLQQGLHAPGDCCVCRPRSCWLCCTLVQLCLHSTVPLLLPAAVAVPDYMWMCGPVCNVAHGMHACQLLYSTVGQSLLCHTPLQDSCKDPHTPTCSRGGTPAATAAAASIAAGRASSTPK